MVSSIPRTNEFLWSLDRRIDKIELILRLSEELLWTALSCNLIRIEFLFRGGMKTENMYQGNIYFRTERVKRQGGRMERPQGRWKILVFVIMAIGVSSGVEYKSIFFRFDLCGAPLLMPDT